MEQLSQLEQVSQYLQVSEPVWYRNRNKQSSRCYRKTAGSRRKDQNFPDPWLCTCRGNRYLRFHYRTSDRPSFEIMFADDNRLKEGKGR